MELFIALSSLVISFLAFGFSYYSFRRTQKDNIMPVLVFSRIRTDTWQIKNVGKGVAMSIIVASKESTGKWGNTVSFYPIALGGIVEIPWANKGENFAASYKDIKGNQYSSLCRFGENQFYETNEFPEFKSGMDEQSFRDMVEEYKRLF
jgi:hypothetical protein